MIATFQYSSKNSQKKEMLIQIIAICHFWIKLSSIKKKTQFNNLNCFSKIQPQLKKSVIRMNRDYTATQMKGDVITAQKCTSTGKNNKVLFNLVEKG